MYVAETAPANKKGMFGAMFQLSLTVGILLSFAAGYAFTYVKDENLSWRLMVVVGIIFPASLTLLTFCAVEETKDFKRSHDDGEARELRSQSSTTEKHSGWKGLFAAEHRKEFITGVVLAGTLQLTGINAVMYYGPTIIKKSGLDNEVLLNIIIGGWNFVATFIAVFLVERAGRRVLMITGTAIMSVALVGIGIAFKVTEGTPLAIAVSVGLFFFIGGFEGGPGCLFWVLVNEVYPPHIRDAGGSFANILQWGFNLLVASLFQYVANAIGWSVIFWVFGGIGVLCTIYLFFFLASRPKVQERFI